MNLTIIPCLSDIRPAQLTGKTAVVIDALRATTVIARALDSGAQRVLVAQTVNAARKLADGLPGALLCGERHGLRIRGFALDNSPHSCTPEAVSGKTLVMTTTNGTCAIARCARAERLYLAAFVNARAVADRLFAQGHDCAVACAGTEGEFSLEDFLCAGQLASYLAARGELAMNDYGWAAKALYESHADAPDRVLRNTKHYGNLMRLGFEADVRYCLTRDVLDVVPLCAPQGIVASTTPEEFPK